MEPIAVLGYAVQLPGISTPEQLFDVLREKQQRAVHRDDVNYPRPGLNDDEKTGNTWKYRVLRGNYFTWEEALSVDHRVLKLGAKDPRTMSLLQALSVEIAFRAIEDAGLRLEDLHRSKTGVFCGSYDEIRDYQEAPDETTIRGMLDSSVADKVGYYLGTYGPSVTTDTACSSGLTALALAVAALRKGDCDTALVISLNVRACYRHLLAMQAVGVLSESGYSRPFDEDSDGMGRAEGYGCVVLRRMGEAERQNNDIIATIVNASLGAAGPVDEADEGAGRSYEATCAAGIHQLMKSTCEQAGVPFEHVRYVEAHATGTKAGDLTELQAIARTFRASHDSKDNPLRVASIKGNIGHAETAAGIFSLIKVLEMIRRRTFLPTGGLTKPRSDFNWAGNHLVPALEAEPFPNDGRPIFIGINAFGLGGGYAHALLTEYHGRDQQLQQAITKTTPRHHLPQEQASPIKEPAVDEQQQSSPSSSSYQLLPLSAVSDEHLSRYETALADYLDAHPEVSLRDLCATLTLHRSRFRYCRAYVASSAADLSKQLRQAKEGPATAVATSTAGVAMVFTGQGAQWLGCGKQLMALPVYRRAVQEVDRIFTSLSGWSLIARMEVMSAEDLMQTQYAQPVTFMVQVGLFEVLISLGVTPSVVLGHSAGEVPAAYAAGLLTLHEAVGVVYHRSQEQQKLAGSGRMLAVGISEEKARSLLASEEAAGLQVEVACVNSPNGVVLAGTEEDLKALTGLLPEGASSTFIPGNIAFHCARTQPIVDTLHRRLSKFFTAAKQQPQQPQRRLPFISTVTGQLQDQQQGGGLDADYWVSNVRQPVLFQQAVETLCQVDPLPSLVLEIGPHRTLAGPLMQTVTAVGVASSFAALPTLRRNSDDLQSLLACLAQLTLRGHPLRFSRLYKPCSYRMLRDLPPHPMIRKLLRGHLDDDYWQAEGSYARQHRGTHAGGWVGVHGFGGLATEVSESACPLMMHHVIGGTKLLPGTYFVEAAIEAAGGAPCFLTNVEFLNRCPIPLGEQPATVLSTTIDAPAAEGEASSGFKVRSTPVWVAMEADSGDKATLHCQGQIGSLKLQFSDDGHGRRRLVGLSGRAQEDPRVSIRDIGPEGLASLRKRHQTAVVSSVEEAYAAINKTPEAMCYGPSFQLLQELHLTSDRRSMVARLQLPSDVPVPRNYSPQLLDSIGHAHLLHPDQEVGLILYNGGFESAYYVRPLTEAAGKDIYVHLVDLPDRDVISLGRKSYEYNIHVYDSDGRLLVAFGATFSIRGGQKSAVRLYDMSWQPYTVTKAPLPRTTTNGQVLPQLLMSLCQAKRAACSSKDGEEPRRVLVRVLECVEDEASSAMVLKALTASAAQLQAWGVMVEVYVATHQAALIEGLGVNVGAEAGSWVRARRAFLPSALPELHGFAFDAIVLGDGGHSWGGHDAMLKTLRGLACPGTVLLFRNADAEAAASLQQHLSEGEGVEVIGEQLVMARLVDVGLIEQRSSGVLVVADTEDLASRFQSHLPQPGSVMLVGPVTDGAKEESALVEDLKRHLATGVLSTIVFLGGLSDGSLLGSDGTYRLIWLLKALAKVLKQEEGSGREVDVWVATQGCFGGSTIRIGQSSLYAVSRHVEPEVGNVCCRYADMDSLEGGLPQLARLVASHPVERNFRLLDRGDGQQQLVQRYFLLEEQDRCWGQVSADDAAMAYHAEVLPVAEAPVPGQVCLKFLASPREAPKDDEVTVQIKAAGLNFRDVLLAVSMLPVASLAGSAFGRRLGMEAAGVVVAVGKDIAGMVKVGDRVVTAEPNSFGSFQNVRASRVQPLPQALSFEDGAAAASVYATAHYALVNLARIRKGERVLIHAAAGGVGQAAVSVCQYLGAEVYATASKPKRALVEQLGVPPSRIFDSRSTSWFEDLMRETQGKGVHGVLNSLAGVHQQLGLRALAPNGRFLEIGKMDIYKNSAVGQLSLCKNGSFFAIDMDRLARDDPDLSLELTREVFNHLAAGHYRLVPVTTFPMDRIKEAMELMRSGKHTGKIVLVNQGAQEDAVVSVPAKLPPSTFRPDRLYLVTGGAGGFGSRIVEMAVKQGARHIVITVSRDPSRVAQLFESQLAAGVRIEAVQADLSQEEDVAKVVEYCRSQSLPWGGIFHCSGFSTQEVLAEIQLGDLERLAGPKNRAAWWLHERTLDLQPPLQTFAVISSVSTDVSGRHMTIYGATNAMLNGFVRYRRALGLPGVALNMTALNDVGIVANNLRMRQAQKQSGAEFISSGTALKDLSDAVVMEKEMVVELQLQHDIPTLGRNRASGIHNIDEPFTVGAQSKERGPVQTEEEVAALIVATVSAITKSQDVLLTSMLANVGLDSLSLIELTSRIKESTGVDVPTSQLGMTTTIQEVVTMIWKKRQVQQQQQASSATSEGATQAVPSASSGDGGVSERQDKSKLVLALPSRSARFSAFDDDDDRDDQKSVDAQSVQQEQEGRRPRDVSKKEENWEPAMAVRAGGFEGCLRKCSHHAEIVTHHHDAVDHPHSHSQPFTSLPFNGKTGARLPPPKEEDMMSLGEAEKWIRVMHKAPNAKKMLILVPSAAAGTDAFSILAPDIADTVAIEIPGRPGSRESEEPMYDIELLGLKIAQAISRVGLLEGKPLAILGHSSGAVIAFEVCWRLQQMYGYTVERLFNVAMLSPTYLYLCLCRFPTSILNCIVSGLIYIGGARDTVFSKNRQDRDFVTRVRLDIVALRNYCIRQRARLSQPGGDSIPVPITSMVGRKDRLLFNLDVAKGWKRLSSKQVENAKFYGGHYFIFNPNYVGESHVFFDEDFKRPELMGCCLVPDIEQVYAADVAYSKKDRLCLHSHVENKFSRMSPFPQPLREALVGKKPLALRGLPVYGSPLLDFELNYGWPLGYVQDELEKDLDIMTPKRQAELKAIARQQELIKQNQWAGAVRGSRGTGKKRKAGPPISGPGDEQKPAKNKSPQKGEELPPAPPATWVQCDDPGCLKWRRLTWFVEEGDLPTPFYCKLNTWRPSEASCDVPQEPWDDEEETTLQFSEGNFEDLKPGDWVDTHCEQNKVWYEAVVREREGGRVKVHFHLWPDKFDEWIDISAGRFAPHKSFTKVTKDYVNRRKRAERASRRRKKNRGGGGGGGDEDDEGDGDDDDEEEEEEEEEEDQEEEKRKKAKEEEEVEAYDWEGEGGVRSSRRRRRKSAALRDVEESQGPGGGGKKKAKATAEEEPSPATATGTEEEEEEAGGQQQPPHPLEMMMPINLSSTGTTAAAAAVTMETE